jgi:hypothetical protein
MNRRTGSFLIESAIALALLVSVCVAVAVLNRTLVRARSSLDSAVANDRQIASAAERFYLADFEAIAEEAESLAEDGSLQIVVDEVNVDDVEGRRIRISTSGASSSTGLTLWRFAPATPPGADDPVATPESGEEESS